ncbi:hypothetical protein FOXB_15362, partial [Fusarium oxysporum f. sp. conglutinans Fo5176]
YVF